MTQQQIDPPFGAFALPAPLERLRAETERMRSARATRLVRRFIRTVWRKPADVTIFGTQRVRLHLYDNRTEKRLFCGSQFFDPAERAAIAASVAQSADPFVFVDVGANVGAYTLMVRALLQEAGRPGRLIAVEPDPVNASRLEANIAANAATDVELFRVGLSDRSGTLRFRSEGLENRGRARVADDGEIELPVRPLLDLLEEAGLDRVDALKMDVEGHEEPILRAFLRDAPEAMLPRLIVLETWHDRSGQLDKLLLAHGYAVVARPSENTIFARPTAASEMDETDGET
ncbi:FkbM family methyltransferase [Jannaschia formosa]|uniref:FkbM family methyltransferase n=1 Tax=Jannaschia formosa TaxID=2259592 RepID=UPI0014310140|nr:FkbM family methyltransferase [Jannaschia formosa]